MSTTKARADSLSLLLFTLRSGKLMAINLLKVSEIIPCPPLTKLPEAHPHVKGITIWGYVNGRTWIEGSGLISENGTPRPAMTWLLNNYIRK